MCLQIQISLLGCLVHLGALQVAFLDLESGLSGLGGSLIGYIVCLHPTRESTLACRMWGVYHRYLNTTKDGKLLLLQLTHFSRKQLFLEICFS